MARDENDREDLLREATALVERIELRVPHELESIVIGFRRDGSASFFFGAEPVLQFNVRGELRRAYADGKLVKAEHGRLVELTRVRTPTETQLVRREWADEQTASFVSTAATRLTSLRDGLAGPIEIVGQVPAGADVLSRVRQELARLAEEIRIAASPRVG